MIIKKTIDSIFTQKTNNLFLTKIFSEKVKSVLVDSGNTVSSYGKDIESELTKILSEQIAKEIDRDILRGLGIEPDRNKRRKISINKIYKNETY